ncbi:hypothetical protein HG537_0D04020 [Torulaspora globosa]|uniref:Very long-chain fatty acid transport protein n=1 Tax=Torulaspora globosa TaxID=48254 RepID=A0A7H9HSV6_9SACH|nr:hypothetical protein HG537_0D04020 [Torulaspora sp. CBS 2947]
MRGSSVVQHTVLKILTLCYRVLKLVILPIWWILCWILQEPINALDRKYRIREDFYIIPFFLKSLVKYIYTVRQNRFQYWYLFIKQVKKNGNGTAICYPRPLDVKGEYKLESYTYNELYEIVLRLSHILHYQYGVEAGDHIGLDCTNKPLFVFLLFALWNIGAIPALLNCNTLGNHLVHSLKIASVKKVFIDPQASEPMRETEALIKETIPDIELNYLEEESLMRILADPRSPEFLQLDDIRSPKGLADYKPALFIYTSGTTGLPKSAIMSWRKAVFACHLFSHVFRMTRHSVVFTAMPLFHSTAAMLGMCSVLSQGGCLAMANKFSASNFWKEVYLTKATHIQYVGEICRYLLQTPVSKYERMHTVKMAYGNGLRPDIWQKFRKRFNIETIGEFYAATEAPFATTCIQKGDFAVGACKSYGSIINWFLSFQQVLVRMDPDDDSTIYRNSKGFCDVPAIGEPGELLMKILFPKKPETSFQGYLGNKKETQSKVLRNVFKKGDAYYRCGDLFRQDENGFLYFLDRLGDTYRWKSENVSTTEVEDQIMSCNDKDFAQVVVVGVKIPGYEGRAGFAVIKLADYKSISEQRKLELLDNLLVHLKRELPSYARPIFIKFTDKIEMTDTNKISKKTYKNQVLPKGVDNSETIYWLKNYKQYKVLTDEDWQAIVSQDVKL